MQSLIKIFAILANNGEAKLQGLIDLYVSQILSGMIPQKVVPEYKARYNHYLENIEKQKFSYNIEPICDEINNEFSKQQRFMLLVTLIELAIFVQKNEIVTNSQNQLASDIQKIASSLRVSDDTFQNCRNFVANKFYNLSTPQNVVYVKAQNPNISSANFIQVNKLKGYFVFNYFGDTDVILFKYYGSEHIEFNSNAIIPKKIYTMECGSIFELNGEPIFYYNDVVLLIRKIAGDQKITLLLQNVSFCYSHSGFGIKNISIGASSGHFIGVLGGSGVGKSTLFNIINGSLNPQSGSISINGHSLSSSKGEIQHLIGFVPQEESLFENLTVFENLFYSASLSMGALPQDEIVKLVNRKLVEFGLYDIRNNRVGSPLRRNISGGQRKRLNIVLELIREPKLLLVDEPTSGLSTVDSIKVMTLLKEQTFQGRLVMVNIHQPSTAIYRLFDKVLILDQGGYMDYYGNPLEAIKYFKQQSKRVDFDNVLCEQCGSIKSDQIFEIIEDKQVDADGNYMDSRKVSAEVWNHRFLSQNTATTISKSPLPSVISNKAGPYKQFAVFFVRFFFSKCRDVEFLVLSLAAPILLSFGISFFSKNYVPSELDGYKYVFYENINIPISFFTSIIACIFIGMIISADTMLKEAGTNARETNLFLNRTSYYNSKVVFFFFLSLLQSIIFSAVPVFMLQIKGMFFQIEVVMLAMCMLGNLIGLIISSIFKSLSAVYLVVPFLVIPLIVLSGITIPYNKMHYSIANPQNVPAIANATPSMWALEALIVDQYCDNAYEKYFFDVDYVESNARLKSQYLIPKLFELTSRLAVETDARVAEHIKCQVISGLSVLEPTLKTDNIFENAQGSLPSQLGKVDGYLVKKQKYYQVQYSCAVRERDSITTALIGRFGSAQKLNEFRQMHVNRGTEKICLARDNLIAYQLVDDEMVQLVDPILLSLANSYGRAHFLAPHKNFAGLQIKTFNFDMVVLCLFLVLFYVVLIFDVAKRIPKILKNVGW